MVSEDSQEFGWLSVVHRLNNLGDLDQTISGEMPPMLHHIDDRCKLLKVLSLRRSQGIRPEERDDHIP
jgi:hypothetical protein